MGNWPSNWKTIRKSWNPVEVHFGSGSSQNLAETISTIGRHHVFFVTDRFLHERTDLARNLERVLESNSIERTLFADVEPEPKLEVAKNITKAIRNDQYDCVVGLGGGSVLDMAKVAAGMYTNAGEVHDYLGTNKLKNQALDLVLIPTTAGTGSDVTNRAMLTADEKSVIASNCLYARFSLADPRLTLTLPERVTADTGFDSLSHAIEGIMSNERFEGVEEVEEVGFEAVRLILQNIRGAVEYGNDLATREKMMYAALLSGFVLSKKAMVYGHSIGYTFASKYRIPHGRSAIMALPDVIEFSAQNVECEAKIAKLAEYVGMGEPSQSMRSVSQFVAAIRKLSKEIYGQLAIPITLRGIGVPRADLARMAKLCLERWPRPTSPVEASEDSIVKIYLKMWNE